jgi:hypothetical protein
VSVRPVVLLGVKGVRVSTPFINAFQKKKAWNLPKSFTNLSDFKNLFFSSSKCGDFKTLFFPLLEMWRFRFFFGNFPKCSLHHVCFHGGLFNGFSSQKNNKIKIKLAVLHLCVCLSWFKERGRLHSVRRSQVPTSMLYWSVWHVHCFWASMELVRQQMQLTRRLQWRWGLACQIGIHNRFLCRHWIIPRRKEMDNGKRIWMGCYVFDACVFMGYHFL